MQNLLFRKATVQDLPFLVALREATMREHVERSQNIYDEEKQLQRVKDKYDCAQIIVLNGEDIGLLKMDGARTPWKLLQIQILPEYQRKGIGEEIIRQILDDAESIGASVTLRVLKGNPAKRLYERLGFRAEEERESSFVMRYP